MITVTPLEWDIIQQLVHNEFSADGLGLGGYIYHDENDMARVRGAMSSLTKKGIVGSWCDETGDKGSTWGHITKEFQTKSDNEYGFELTNIERRE